MTLHVIIDSNYNNDGGWVTNYLPEPLRHLHHLSQQDTLLLANHHLYLLHLLDIGDHLLVPHNILHIDLQPQVYLLSGHIAHLLHDVSHLS